MSASKDLNRNIRALARLRGVTQAQMAQASGIALATFRRKVNDQSTPLDINQLAAVAELLGITPGRLMSPEMGAALAETG